MSELLWIGGMFVASWWGLAGFLEPEPEVVQELTEARIAERPVDESASRTPILPPIPPGKQATCDDPPTEQEILRAIPQVTRGIPYICDVYRDEIEFTVEKLVDRVDPPRFFPLIGPAQLHHCHWKCTVHFTETFDSSYPFPFQSKQRRSEVVYIDNDRLHLYVSARTNVELAVVYAEMAHENAGVASQVVQAACKAERAEADLSERVSVEDVANMARNGVSAKIILRQIETTNSMFKLSANEIIVLHQQGVSDRVIGAMQDRRPGLHANATKEPQIIRSPSGADQDRAEIALANQAAIAQAACKQVTLTDIVLLTQRHTPDDLIIRQIDQTGSIFNLTSADLAFLQAQGVSRNVIAALLMRRGQASGPAASPPPPEFFEGIDGNRFRY